MLYGVRDPQDLKQRHEQMLREVEMDRLARASRAARKSRAGAGWGRTWLGKQEGPPAVSASS